MRSFAPHTLDFYKVGHINQYPSGTVFENGNVIKGVSLEDIRKVTE